MFLLGGVLGFVALTILTYVYFAQKLETKEAIINNNNTGITLLDRNGTPFFTFYSAQTKSFVPLNQIPDYAKKAVIVAEDKNFYQHPGFSPLSIIGALIADIKNQKLAYGGSTITQQLVKISLLSSNKNFLRKYQELVLAQEVERRYTKDEILEMYLNSVYFGEGAFGIEQASNRYFGKSASQLDLSEATLLASLLPAPSRLSPISGDLSQAKKRQEIVLNRLVEDGSISLEQKDQSLAKEYQFGNAENINYKAPHFALMVKDELINKYGEEEIARSGYVVKTTLDLTKQDLAEKEVAKQVAALAKNKVTNGAAVVEDPKTGEILALVGSKDWNDPSFGKINMATTPRQPGSAFKPIIYLGALEKNIITPATVLKDIPTTFKVDTGGKEYKPLNYDKKFRGNVLVRRALANSLNIPSVQIMSMLGLDQGLEIAQRLGISTLKKSSDYGLSLVLGTGEVRLIELTNAYSTIANSGMKNDPTLILEIRDKKEKLLYSYKPKNEKVVSDQYTFLISSILSDNKARAEMFGKALSISRPAAVKTGTTENYKDALTIGYTPDLTVGVWVGNTDNSQMDQIAGSLGAAPIWRDLMEQFSKGQDIAKFEKPQGVVEASICSSNGFLSREATSSAYKEYFAKGSEPRKYCNNANVAKESTPAGNLVLAN